MRLKGVKVGFALTGSHCTIDEVLSAMQKLVDEGAVLYPIISTAVHETDTRFGAAQYWKDRLAKLTDQKILTSIVDVEPIGPQGLLDVMVVAPCTGNTLAKLANAITDGAVLMAVKAHLRNARPVVLAVSTNDGLGLNAKNLGLLLNIKHIFMVPFGQDSPLGKPNSLKADTKLMVDTIELALQGKQIQPMLIGYN